MTVVRFNRDVPDPGNQPKTPDTTAKPETSRPDTKSAEVVSLQAILNEREGRRRGAEQKLQEILPAQEVPAGEVIDALQPPSSAAIYQFPEDRIQTHSGRVDSEHEAEVLEMPTVDAEALARRVNAITAIMKYATENVPDDKAHMLRPVSE